MQNPKENNIELTKLTENEKDFLLNFLENNGCGAETPRELLDDNFSCQCIEDLRYIFPNLSNNQIGGYLTSLQEKGVIYLDERDGAVCESSNPIKKLNFEPDLYWVSNEFLEEIAGKSSENKTFLELIYQ